MAFIDSLPSRPPYFDRWCLSALQEWIEIVSIIFFSTYTHFKLSLLTRETPGALSKHASLIKSESCVNDTAPRYTKKGNICGWPMLLRTLYPTVVQHAQSSGALLTRDAAHLKQIYCCIRAKTDHSQCDLSMVPVDERLYIYIWGGIPESSSVLLQTIAIWLFFIDFSEFSLKFIILH